MRAKHPSTRPMLERLAGIIAQIQQGMYPNINTLAAQFEVSKKTIERDIEFLRDRLNVPIQYDPRRWGWFYTSTMGPALPAFVLTRTATR